MDIKIDNKTLYLSIQSKQYSAFLENTTYATVAARSYLFSFDCPIGSQDGSCKLHQQLLITKRNKNNEVCISAENSFGTVTHQIIDKNTDVLLSHNNRGPSIEGLGEEAYHLYGVRCPKWQWKILKTLPFWILNQKTIYYLKAIFSFNFLVLLISWIIVFIRVIRRT